MNTENTKKDLSIELILKIGGQWGLPHRPFSINIRKSLKVTASENKTGDTTLELPFTTVQQI